MDFILELLPDVKIQQSGSVFLLVGVVVILGVETLVLSEVVDVTELAVLHL